MAEQEQDKLLIRLHVYDTDLSVRIPREDEEYYRKSAKLIDDIVNSYTKIFKGRKSDKEILYMALIQNMIKMHMLANMLTLFIGVVKKPIRMIWY